jgi:hypothetical protein
VGLRGAGVTGGFCRGEAREIVFELGQRQLKHPKHLFGKFGAEPGNLSTVYDRALTLNELAGSRNVSPCYREQIFMQKHQSESPVSHQHPEPIPVY